MLGVTPTAGHGHPGGFELAHGFIGQCAVEKRRMLIAQVPPDTVTVRSVFFQALPRSIVVLPVLFEDQVKAVIELASLRRSAPRTWRSSNN